MHIVNGEVFSEGDAIKADVVRAWPKADYEEVRACAPVKSRSLAHLHPSQLGSSEALFEDVLVYLRGEGIVPVSEVGASDRELQLYGEGGVVAIVETELEEILARDVGDGVLLANVTGEGCVDDGRVMEFNPLHEVGPDLWVSGLLNRAITEDLLCVAQLLVSLAPVLLLTFFTLHDVVLRQQRTE